MPVTVRVTCADGAAQLQVVDRGPGIPAQDRERIFDRYTRLDGTSGRPGVGLGLYIVRTIAENHGGAVRIAETEGGGATFIVELPCAGTVVDGEAVLGETVCDRQPGRAAEAGPYD
jgi:signal transduction histidine kinase